MAPSYPPPVGPVDPAAGLPASAAGKPREAAEPPETLTPLDPRPPFAQPVVTVYTEPTAQEVREEAFLEAQPDPTTKPNPVVQAGRSSVAEPLPEDDRHP